MDRLTKIRSRHVLLGTVVERRMGVSMDRLTKIRSRHVLLGTVVERRMGVVWTGLPR